MCDSTETGGSATELSATDADTGPLVGDEGYVRLTSIVARSSFIQKARNLGITKGVSIQKRRGQLAPASAERATSETKMSCSGRTPSFEIVRKCFMVSPQERHTMVGVLLATGGECSIAEVEGV